MPNIAAENRPQLFYAWRGPSMIILDAEGAAGVPENSGFFFRQTRYLRDLRLELFGERAHLCSVAEIAPNELEFTYVYPEKRGGGSDWGGEHNGIPYGDLDLRLIYKARANGLIATLRVVNRWMDRASVDAAWVLSADFADYSELFGERRQTAPITSDVGPGGVRFRYRHPELPFETVVQIEGGSWNFTDGRFEARLELERQSEMTVTLNVQAIDHADPITDEQSLTREARLDAWQKNITFVDCPGNAAIGVIANQSMTDIGSLSLLEGAEDEWLTPAAGLPQFQSLWARDALTTVWQATIFDRGEMGDAVLSTLGRLQGKRNDPWRDEQPGRIIRGMQRSPLVRLNLSPFGRYYGDYASPFAFIFVLAQLYAWSGDRSLLQKHFDVAVRILDWAFEHGDIDGDGYLEYKTLSRDGPKHQGWRDAQNAIVYEDGTQVHTPIATCEIQGYWFAALQIMAVLSTALRKFKRASAYWKAARNLKERFNRDFWMAGEACVAVGLDPDKKQIKVVTSNAGQTLTTGIVDDEKIPLLVDRLFQPDMFSGWGIRTLTTNNPAYSPLSYHLGSIWPVENATLLFGLKRFGFEQEVQTLAKALYDLALIWRLHRIPECIGGYSREDATHPSAYPQANAPQAWNQSVFPILIQTLLGIQPLGPLKTLAVYPRLPEWIPELTLRNLRVADARVSLKFHGDKFEILEKKGTLHLIEQPPIDSTTVGPWDRLRALIEGIRAA